MGDQEYLYLLLEPDYSFGEFHGGCDSTPIPQTEFRIGVKLHSQLKTFTHILRVVKEKHKALFPWLATPK